MTSAVFPFGRPARVAPPTARPAQLFVLGAYPSALHIRWVPPEPHKPIRALAVDAEPHAFWNGADEAERVDAWKRAVGWRAEWGAAEPVGRLNGSSGVWVDEHILGPLGVAREDAWITDCLHWYCASTGGAKRIADTYAPFAAEHGLPEALLPKHPSETAIVKAADAELDRLRAELRAGQPKQVVTLGNAALRVMRKLVDGELPKKLCADAGYGTPVAVRFEAQEFEVLPLAHPAAPKAYQAAHASWAQRRAANDSTTSMRTAGRSAPKAKKRRTEIPPTRVDEVSVEADRTCCVCRRRRDLQMHHLNENPADHRFENLIGLCPNCHSDGHSSAGFTRKLTRTQLRRFRDDWYKSVRERKAKGLPRFEFVESPDFDTVVEAVAVVRIREIGRDPTEVDLGALHAFSSAFGSRVALEVLGVLSGVLLYERDDANRVRDACGLLSEFLPFESLVGSRNSVLAADELLVLDQAGLIARDITYYAACHSHDLVVLDAGGRLLWKLLRVGVLNGEKELRDGAAGMLQEMESLCVDTSFDDGWRWIHFLHEDAVQVEKFEGEFPADLSSKIAQLRRGG